MRIAIMQPYFFPYIGYFQLINAVDTFVIYDDVNYIKQGWVNPNRILLNGKEFVFNLIIKGASSFKLINEIEVHANQQKLLKTITQAYKKAPYYEQVFPIINEIISYQDHNLARYLSYSLSKLINYFQINVNLLVSSSLTKNIELKGVDKVLDICKNQSATHYINSIGGQSLYSREKFNSYGIQLNFIKSNPINYNQYENEFIPWLSIIDIMMFNSVKQIANYLNNYELL